MLTYIGPIKKKNCSLHIWITENGRWLNHDRPHARCNDGDKSYVFEKRGLPRNKNNNM